MRAPPQFVLHQIKVPDKQILKAREIITMHLLQDGGTLECDPFHQQGRVFTNLGLRPGDRALILSLRLTYSANNSGRDVHLDLCNVFEARKGNTTKHPDVTGVIHIVIPARHNGVVPESAQMIYRPNLVNLGVPIIQYAGMEEAILNARSSAITVEAAHDEAGRRPSYQVFQEGDALLVYMQQHAHLWKHQIGPQDIVQLKSGGYYKVSNEAVRLAQSVFKTALFPLFCYTHPHHEMHLEWQRSMEPPPLMPPHLVESKQEVSSESGFAMITFELEMEYLLISNTIGSVSFEVIKTNIH